MTDTEAIIEHGDGIVAVRADNPGALTLTGTQTYVIGNGRVVILDPGPLDEMHLERVDHVVAGRCVEAVCLTHAHWDHTAAAAVSADRWGTLRGSADTLKRLKLNGVPLVNDEVISLDEGFALRILATPGHSGDHLCYLVESTRDLFTGDLVLGEGSSLIAHPDGSVRAYLISLDKLAALQPSRLIPGHGPVVNAAAKKLEASRVHRLERAKQVLRAVEGGADTLEDIRDAVYCDLPGSYHAAAQLSIRAYLAYLAEEGHEVPVSLH